MLRTIRRIAAVVFLLAITLLFLDFTGTAARWFGWMAKIQFLPALLALNTGVLILLLLITLVFGRIYCSVICPLGVMQDAFACLGKRVKKNRYRYSKAKTALRYQVLALMAIAVLFGASYIVALLAPYSAYGRIVHSLLSPIWAGGNNLLASWSEAHDNYIFHNVEGHTLQVYVFSVAVVTLLVLGILSFLNGRTYCNTICPVGTVLGFLSRFSFLKPVIDTSKCNSCGLCARNCKASCINSEEHNIDYTRCVACFDCLGKCKKGAISYIHPKAKKEAENTPKDTSRRQFLSIAAIAATTAVLKAEEKTVDGGLAFIEDKKIPPRKTKIVPPGALGISNLESHCTACQLCISACPNGVLRPSTELDSFMQPESSYENGYCRPECTRCSNVCPTGAIKPISREDKSSVQIGHAVWIKQNCLPISEGVRCGNCERHCPTGAISMVEQKDAGEDAPKIPVINTEKCIGCGACENLCPSRPFSAIYVEGHEKHRII